MSINDKKTQFITFCEAIQNLQNVDIDEIDSLIDRIDVPVLRSEDVLAARLFGFSTIED